MDDAVRAREAAWESLEDVEPVPLRDAIDDRLADASMTPAALAIRSARAVDPDADPDAVHGRAAGVQLIYEGLRLTRRLANEEPWATANLDADLEADLAILAADVLVSRGFYLLARTPAAERAVEVVRSFGRDQTERRGAADPAAFDRELEADALALAAVAGATIAGGEPPSELVAFAADLGRRLAGDDPGFPETGAALDGVDERLTRLATGRDVDDASDGEGPVTRSATDP